MQNKDVVELNPSIGKEDWLTSTGLEKEYGFSKSTQAKYRMARKIPYSKIGRYIRYNRHEINKWLEDHSVQVA